MEKADASSEFYDLNNLNFGGRIVSYHYHESESAGSKVFMVVEIRARGRGTPDYVKVPVVARGNIADALNRAGACPGASIKLQGQFGLAESFAEDGKRSCGTVVYLSWFRLDLSTIIFKS